MPRIPDKPLQGVAFLYPTEDDALKNARLGGTGFIVSKKFERVSTKLGYPAYCPYMVSCRHVVWTGGSSVMRWNRRDGGTRILGSEPTDWTEHPDGDDLVALNLFNYVDMVRDHLSSVPTHDFITSERALALELGVGDEVVMIGRFLNHQGRGVIKPAVRFGSISMMPEPVWNKAINADQLSYAVEMRSRTGFSGAPVSVYRTPATILSERTVETFWGVLGVCWGYIVDPEDGENSWLNGVIPAWKVLELLETQAMTKRHDEIDKNLVSQAEVEGGAEPAVATIETDKTKKGANPDHKEDFTALLHAAAKTKKQGD